MIYKLVATRDIKTWRRNLLVLRRTYGRDYKQIVDK